MAIHIRRMEMMEIMTESRFHCILGQYTFFGTASKDPGDARRGDMRRGILFSATQVQIPAL